MRRREREMSGDSETWRHGWKRRERESDQDYHLVLSGQALWRQGRIDNQQYTATT